MSWFWLAIAAFPDTQKKAQAELDEVVGRHRLPTFADYPRLPYIRALVKESLRWKTVDPLGELQILFLDFQCLINVLVGVPRRVMEVSWDNSINHRVLTQTFCTQDDIYEVYIWCFGPHLR